MISAVVIGFVINGPISNALGVGGELPFTLPALEPMWVVAFTFFFLLGFVLIASGVVLRRAYGIRAAREIQTMETRRSSLVAERRRLEPAPGNPVRDDVLVAVRQEGHDG